MINTPSSFFPSTMVLMLISSFLIAVSIVGLAISRFYTRRKQHTDEASFSVTRYCRRQLASTSCDNLTPSPALKHHHETLNETTQIIKSSFSWPEVTRLAEQQQHGSESSSSISSSSLTMEPILEPASLTFGLRWNEGTSSLFVRVVSARNLVVHQQATLLDSYVRIQLLSSSKDSSQEDAFPSMRTHIVKKNMHPVYDELVEFNHLETSTGETFSLCFTILTYDTFTRDEIVGEILVPVGSEHFDSTEQIFTSDITARRQQLANQQLGQMLISLCYQPADSTLKIVLLKAANLPRLETTKLINPYFKIYMFYKNQRISKKRSTIRRTTQSPVYNECFTFAIPDNDLPHVYFDFVLFDYDRHRKHEPIGQFSIGNRQADIDQHWNDVCHRQVAKQIAQWYQLKPFNTHVT